MQRSRLTDNERIAMRGKCAGSYARGMTVREVAAKHGLTFSTTLRLLKESGMTLRPRGSNTPGRRKSA